MSAASRPRLIELTGPAVRGFVWLYFAAQAVLAVWTLGDVRSPWPTLIGVLLFAIVCVALTRDRGERLGTLATMLAVGLGPVCAVLISWQVVQGGYSQWYFGASAVVLFFIGLRGRLALAWASFAVMAVIVAAWGATTETGLASALGLGARQAAVLVVGTLFAIGLQRTRTRFDQVSLELSARVSAEAAGKATEAARRERLAALDALATPLLSQLMAGKALTEADRQEFAVAEAELRDGLRARVLGLPTVVDAVRRARRRGVGVVLMDDRGSVPLPAADLERIAAITREALLTARDGQVTARLLPPGREHVATIVVDGSAYERHEIPGTDGNDEGPVA